MTFVETEIDRGVITIRLNRPDRLNALGTELRAELNEAYNAFRDNPDIEVAILTGTGRAFCVGEDMKETVERGAVGAGPGSARVGFLPDPIDKPIITAINGFAMGGGFMLAECGDLRVAVDDAILEVSEAKRWLLGGYNHGHFGALGHAVATELAFAFRFTSQRLYELGWINRLTTAEGLLPAAREMADHLLTLPPASRVNTLLMMRAMRPEISPEQLELADRLRNHGAREDLMESRRAFAEKREPKWQGWDNPGDRANTPTLESLRQERGAADRA